MCYIENAFESSTTLARRNFPDADEKELRKQIAKNMQYLRARGRQYGSKTEVDLVKQRDEQKIEKMLESWPKYIEIKHEQFVEEVKDFYFMIKKLKVSVEGEFDCPAKTIALFAHNEEFSYGKDDIPFIVKKVSKECRKTKDIKNLVDQGVLPKIISGNGSKIEIDSFNDPTGPQYGLIGN